MTSEKENLVEKAHQIITAIRQLETSLEDTPSSQKNAREDDLQVTLPLLSCLRDLEEKHDAIRRLHQERFEEVKSETVERVALLIMGLLTSWQNLSKHFNPTRPTSSRLSSRSRYRPWQLTARFLPPSICHLHI